MCHESCPSGAINLKREVIISIAAKFYKAIKVFFSSFQKMRFLRNINVKRKRVLVRTDFNVPLDKEGKIVDDSRIQAALPTIEYLLDNNAKLILMSHLGRPKGKVIENLKMDVVAAHLSFLLGREVVKLDDSVGIKIPNKKVVLLENLRFHKEEEENDEHFAKKLASYGDIYVNDAFGTSHRAHASVEAITRFIPGCAGLLLEKEVKALGNLLSNPDRPFIAILGGAKVSDKIGVIKNLLPKVDALLIGGAMMFTFIKANGFSVGKSLVEEDKVELAQNLLTKAKKKIILPVDAVVAKDKKQDTDVKTVPVTKIPKNYYGLDIGDETVEIFKAILKEARTVFWNGPLGMVEIEQFATATNEIAQFIAELDSTTIIGGGDSVAVVKKLGLAEKISHVSTGGGASLEFLEGKTLPALKALDDNEVRFKL